MKGTVAQHSIDNIVQEWQTGSLPSGLSAFDATASTRPRDQRAAAGKAAVISVWPSLPRTANFTCLNAKGFRIRH